jgi:D-3-phosphoglycerate dehydrogenase / 2-oxoglutarate reductase
VSRKRVLVPSHLLHPAGEEVLAAAADIETIYGLPPEDRAYGWFSPEERREELRAECEEALAQHLGEVEALCPMGVASHLKVDAALLDRAPKLEVLFLPAAGFDAIDVAAASERGVAVVNAPGANAAAVAEHTVGLMLSLARRIADTDRHAHRERRMDLLRVNQTPPRLSILREKTVGIVGFGYVGRSLAETCRHGFGMRVQAYDPFFSPIEARRQGVELTGSLAEMLPDCDFLSVNAPLNAATRNLVGAAELAAMKPTAYLVNTGRGGVVETAALVDALRDGTIAGAGLDVTEPEPLPDGHPLFELENAILTPHSAGNSAEAAPAMAATAAELAVRLLRGERVADVVNPEALEARG